MIFENTKEGRRTAFKSIWEGQNQFSSARQLSKSIKTTSAQISYIMNNKKQVTEKQLIKIACATGYKVAFFRTDSGEYINVQEVK